MHKNIKLAKTSRKALTATMGFVFMISLSACSSNSDINKTVEEKFSKDYVTLTDNIKISNKELWDELKWSADSKLEQYINNVILDEEIQKITKVLSNSGLNEEEQKLYNTYSKRIVDYVVQDVYNFSYKNESYWDDVDALKPIDKAVLEKEYVDSLYMTYGISYDEILNLINEASEENTEAYLKIAKELSEVYYPSYAKELFAHAKKTEEVIKGNEEDEDAEDDKNGYYTNSNYVAEFENEFANQFDLDLLVIRFASKTEFEDTLRAFGVKVYNKEYYQVKENPEKYENKTLDYSEYCKLYDKFSNPTKEGSDLVGYKIDDHNKVLELFVEMYNYLYDGYRKGITSKYTDSYTGNITLNDLRSVTQKIVDNDTVDSELVNTIKKDNPYTHYTHKDLDKISSSFANYAYNTLSLEDNKMYSTSVQSYSDSYYLVYKLDQGENEYSWYKSDMTDDEIFEKIEADAALEEKIQANLIYNDLTSTSINTYLTDELENVKVKIYDEAVEISYSVGKEDYSKTHGNPANDNVLATIEYEDKEYVLNIFEEAAGDDSLVIPGTDKKYGVFEDLATQYGQTTSVDLISKKVITEAAEGSAIAQKYQEVKEENYEFYLDYLEALLYNFANGAYSSSGYPASIGKYNFLMLYFHTADVEEIVDNYYCVQHTTNLLLTDYSNNSNEGVIKFLKSYTDKAYDNYFSLTGKRFVVYFDENDDKLADEYADWKDNAELNAAAKELLALVMEEVYASTESHASTFSRIISEINGSARIAFNDNPVLVENQWAKYRKLGLNVKLEDFTVTNTTYDINKNLKDRLAAYVKNENNQYNLIFNNTIPTEFIETNAEKNPVVTNDGYNILLVTNATLPASAKFENEDTILKDIVVKYNEKDVTIESIINKEDKLNESQIRLYVLQYVASGSSSLTPSSVSSSVNSFLTPVLSRYTADETQRVIIMYFIENATGAKYNDARFNKILEINQQQADNNSEIYQEIYQTVEGYNQFTTWWDDLEAQVGNFLVK